jgi:hypothetical protein
VVVGEGGRQVFGVIDVRQELGLGSGAGAAAGSSAVVRPVAHTHTHTQTQAKLTLGAGTPKRVQGEEMVLPYLQALSVFRDDVRKLARANAGPCTLTAPTHLDTQTRTDRASERVCE